MITYDVKQKIANGMKKLAIKIEKRRHRDSKLASGNWLVAYTYDPSLFPQQFLEQFELISLDGKDYTVK